MSSIGKVSFEHVSAIEHPEYYDGDRPIVSADSVPDEHWTYTERVGVKVTQQYNGLVRIMGDGELIRNPRLFEADAPSEPEWREVKAEATDD